MNGITLQNDGDSFERHYFHLFLNQEFPSYETFWKNFIVPMTNRPSNIHFKTDQELAAIGRGDHDICISQLHYSIFRHLTRTYDIKIQRTLNPDALTEGVFRLVSAQDIAFELLERYLNPGQYDPWISVARGGISGSREARRTWQQSNNFPLQDIRNYRNHLVHGRIMPGIFRGEFFVPRIGVEENYFDWRLITDNPNIRQLIGGDLIPSQQVLEDAWNQTINYIEGQWTQNLI